MNIITKHPIDNLGYNFIDSKYIPKGENEYYLRNQQNNNGIDYRRLSGSEIEILIRNGNTSDDWGKIYVSKEFDPALVKNSKFHGLIRIGKLEPFYLEFHNLRMPVGIYNSHIISCDFGDNVCIDNAGYLSHYIIGNEVMITNVNELATTDYSKFGNGILKDGEKESSRVWIEVRNENGGRRIAPFDGMLAGDAYIWSNHPEDAELQKRFLELTQKEFNSKRGYYGTIGDRCVIKDCDIIKDVIIGTDAYLKGANKLKNLTINSDAERTSQIGEGCEMVNGIVGYGCRIFYGVKAVRFIMAAHSQLKYGARLINSYLGNNSTISCCEVLNTLIFPSHEQHHNNSFLCASLVMGQSNIAAGATIGSNHNSRAADGEIIAGRGFWPGLCVSLKHNSKFASFCILAKGDYPFEMNISLPFCLVSNDVANDKLVLMPGYFFLYNMYALERNAWKFGDRDKRTEKIQKIEYSYLAPDTINELFTAIEILSNSKVDENGNAEMQGVENSTRKTEVVKVKQVLALFKELISYYGTVQLIKHINENQFASFEEFKKSVPVKISRNEWKNIGGQLIPSADVEKLKNKIKSNHIDSWDEVHDFYRQCGEDYEKNKLIHAYTSLLEIENITSKQFTPAYFKQLLQRSVETKTWASKAIYESRAKDYTNPFRQMIYENTDEMNTVIGKLEDNQFIQDQFKDLEVYKKMVKGLVKKYGA
ncbi:MAG: DUF4954 family protein [Bacteroidota bacterium]|nr:DUF4954 family protein [Bacteroidota bacterium]